MLSMTGCYVISAQPMYKLKGTYKLTGYTYTPSHERKEGYTPTTRDYVNGEKYMYEDYLVITGTSIGYYAHKDASGDVYVKEVSLTYEYSKENSKKIEYITYRDVTSDGDEGGVNRLGVNRKQLNYTKISINYTEPFTKRQMSTESLTVRWEKVSRATDYSYAKNALKATKEYEYKAFGARGIYELGTPIYSSTSELVESPYQYFFYVIDTAYGVTKATAHYATKENPTERLTKEVSFSAAADYSTVTVDGKIWTAHSVSGFSSEADGISYTYSLASRSITSSALDALIESKLPTDSN